MQDDGKEKISRAELLAIFQKPSKCVIVSFDESERVYSYRTNLDLEVDDLAVVQVGKCFKVVRVVKVLSAKEHDSKATKWIVQKLETENYDKIIEAENEFLSAIEKRAEQMMLTKKRKVFMDYLSNGDKDEVKAINKLIANMNNALK